MRQQAPARVARKIALVPPDPEEPALDAGEITQLLAAVDRGESGADQRLFALVYDDLRRLARRHVRGAAQGDQGHGATSLVHEAYLRIAKPGAAPIADRRHFFAIASRAMRQLVIDDLRSRKADKRGGGAVELGFDEARAMAPAPASSIEETLAIDRALSELEASSPRLARVVEWHFFGGLTFAEIAAALELTERTVLRDWRAARALLHVRLAGG